MRKNAFTLIELLAVIVILSVIALIAVPVVINIIEDAKEESLKRSVQNYLDAVINTITKENLKVKYNPDTCNIQEDGNLICSENGNELTTSDGTNILKIDIKSKKTESGTIKLKDGKIIDIIDININGKYYGFDSKGKIILTMATQTAGLYDENNNLLATWDELIGEYGLVVYDGVLENGTTIFTKEALSSGCNLIIPNSVTSIGADAFNGCESLTSITIPSSVTNIGERAFALCSSLTSITIPDSVTSIGECAFGLCENLTNITIPSSVTNIGEAAFLGCTSLASITIGSGVTSIGAGAFQNCTSLASITIGSGVTNIGEAAFWGCTSLTSITIPNSVTSIGESVFYECSGLTSITIGNGVTSIGSTAFEGCGSLTSITIPSSVTSIGNYAFYGCYSLTSVIFENTEGWFVASSYDATTGTNINVTNASTNATNLIASYSNYYWKRN